MGAYSVPSSEMSCQTHAMAAAVEVSNSVQPLGAYLRRTERDRITAEHY